MKSKCYLLILVCIWSIVLTYFLKHYSDIPNVKKALASDNHKLKDYRYIAYGIGQRNSALSREKLSRVCYNVAQVQPFD